MMCGSRFFVKFLVICVLLPACGYQFQGSHSVLPEDIQTVYIELVGNRTSEPGLGIRSTEALRSQFERFGALTVVENKEQADSIFEARILSIDNQVRSVTGQTDIELELELVMIMAAELRRSNGLVLWRNPAFRISEPYSSTSDTIVTSSSDFAQGGIGAEELGTLDAREVSRGQFGEALNELVEEAARKLYLYAVASDF